MTIHVTYWFYCFQFGFDGLFFGRLDYQDKDTRLKDKTMELMWAGSDNLGEISINVVLLPWLLQP